MSGIGFPVGSPEYRAEASVGPAREASAPLVCDGAGGDDLARLFPPTPAYGAMTHNQLLDAKTPPRTQESIDLEDLGYRAMMAASRVSVLKGQVRELERAIARAALPQADPPPIEPPQDYPWFDPRNPINCVDPQHPVDSGAAVAFGMPGRQGTPLQEISFLANAIPASAYPVDTVTVYENLNRPLTQIEADYLNGAQP